MSVAVVVDAVVVVVVVVVDAVVRMAFLQNSGVFNGLYFRTEWKLNFQLGKGGGRCQVLFVVFVVIVKVDVVIFVLVV